MKHSHLSTPRQLADCQFTVGHRAAYPHERSHRLADLVIAALAVAVIFAIALGVA